MEDKQKKGTNNRIFYYAPFGEEWWQEHILQEIYDEYKKELVNLPKYTPLFNLVND